MSRRARPSAGLFHVVAPVVAVGVDGAWWPSLSRCHAILTGPASWPWLVSSCRSVVIRSQTGPGIAAELLFGGRERGSRASSPSGRYRARRRRRSRREIRYWVALSVALSCLATILRTTSRCFDMFTTVTHDATRQRLITCHTCPEPTHASLLLLCKLICAKVVSSQLGVNAKSLRYEIRLDNC